MFDIFKMSSRHEDVDVMRKRGDSVKLNEIREQLM